MKVNISIENAKFMTYEFASMQFIPMIGEKIVVNFSEETKDVLTIISRELHISPDGEQFVNLIAKKE